MPGIFLGIFHQNKLCTGVHEDGECLQINIWTLGNTYVQVYIKIVSVYR